MNDTIQGGSTFFDVDNMPFRLKNVQPIEFIFDPESNDSPGTYKYNIYYFYAGPAYTAVYFKNETQLTFTVNEGIVNITADDQTILVGGSSATINFCEQAKTLLSLADCGI